LTNLLWQVKELCDVLVHAQRSNQLSLIQLTILINIAAVKNVPEAPLFGGVANSDLDTQSRLCSTCSGKFQEAFEAKRVEMLAFEHAPSKNRLRLGPGVIASINNLEL
jgi:hypothetical protein